MKPAVLYHTDQAAATRRGILNIAVDIASAEGLEGLSIGRLANELNMSKTGIFAHFGSKEQKWAKMPVLLMLSSLARRPMESPSKPSAEAMSTAIFKMPRRVAAAWSV